MAEYIEKSIIFPAINKAMSENGALGMADVEDIIDDLPRADVQPVKRGRWVAQLNGHVICTFCGKEQKFSSDFCKHCGADMRDDENDRSRNTED